VKVGFHRGVSLSTLARSRLATTAFCVTIVSTSCVVGPTYQVPAAPVPMVPAYKESRWGTWKVGSPSDAIPRGAWWTMFQDPELDVLEARLNITNQTIASAVQSYLGARAEIRAARADYFPTVSVGASGVHTAGITASTTPPYLAPVEISWAPDLFGRVQSAVRQRQYAAQVSAADLESTRLVAQATLAQTFFQLRGQDALQDVLDATVAADAQIVELAQSRYDQGLDTQNTLVEAELTLENAKAQATNAGIARTQYEHAIATLVGVPATDFSLPKRPLSSTPPGIPLGTPSELLERRPDIAGAERSMASANATIGIGYAAYYPSITLSGGAGLASTTLGALLSSPTLFWSLGASVVGTLFDGGKRRATIDVYIAAYNATVASYRQTVLAAFQQVEDYLAQAGIVARELEQQRAAVALAQQAFELETSRYEGGLDPYLALMLQQDALLAARQVLVSLQVEQMTSSVLLVEALGGGWDRSELPTVDQVSKPAAPDTRVLAK
jgi:NodT family efflux transporter outer membrane factor (OMF) lipoprotein